MPYLFLKTLENIIHEVKFSGNGYKTTCGSLNLITYLTTSCNVAVMQDKNAVGLVET